MIEWIRHGVIDGWDFESATNQVFCDIGKDKDDASLFVVCTGPSPLDGDRPMFLRARMSEGKTLEKKYVVVVYF